MLLNNKVFVLPELTVEHAFTDAVFPVQRGTLELDGPVFYYLDTENRLVLVDDTYGEVLSIADADICWPEDVRLFGQHRFNDDPAVEWKVRTRCTDPNNNIDRIYFRYYSGGNLISEHWRAHSSSLSWQEAVYTPDQYPGLAYPIAILTRYAPHLPQKYTIFSPANLSCSAITPGWYATLKAPAPN